MLIYKEYKPTPELQNLVRCYYFYENTGDPSSVSSELVSPDGTFEINFRLDFEQRDMNTYFMALFLRPFVHNPAEMGRILGISFQPWAIYSLLKRPVGTLLDRKLNAESLFGKEINLLYNKIINQKVDKAISLIEEYFEGMYRERDIIIEDVSKRIIESKGMLKMASLYSMYSVSGRRIEQRFFDTIGVTPKYFTRLLKYRNALLQMKRYDQINLTEIAYICGYCDQSHFIREFNYFAGGPPKQYLSSKHTIDDLNLSSIYN